MMILLLGIVLVIGAITSAYVAVNGVPVGRLPSQRISRMTIVETPSLLTRGSNWMVAAVESALKRRGWRPFTAAELEQAGVVMPVANLVVVVSSVTVVAFSAGFLLANLLVGLLLAAVVPVGAKLWLRFRGSRLRTKFANQLPQALQMMAASLRAGHSLPRVLDAVSKEMDAPMGDEFARVVNENRLGRDIVESLESVATRMESIDFKWVAGAIAAQRETGGNLNEILDQVSETIRERQHIRMQVKALSAEGRLSAVILMALPVIIGFYYALVNGEIMTLFIDSTIGKLLLAASLVMYVLGGLWMRSIVRIEF